MEYGIYLLQRVYRLNFITCSVSRQQPRLELMIPPQTGWLAQWLERPYELGMSRVQSRV